MNYTESNKLIAKFLGYKTYEINGYVNVEYSDDNIRTIQDTHYHTSWDWLMPVIKEIYDRVDKENIEEFYCFKHCIPNIDATYKKVVEFIESYNQNFNE